ncbi:MAG: glycosyltransferase family 4 protein [Candidatus Cryptobacteroides sp.]
MSNKLKIFVSAYACEPGLGSEIGVGWHWVLEMSKYFELWVLTRESNRHTIEPWIGEHPEFAGIHFLYFDLPEWARFWKKGLRGVRTYYNIWQGLTDKIVKLTMMENDIRIFHHLTYGNVLWKTSSFGRKQFFIWGPVGGLESIPGEYSRHYDRRSRLIEAVRRTVVKLSAHNGGFKRRCRDADLILCKTGITRSFIPEKYAGKAVLFTDVAADLSVSGQSAEAEASENVGAKAVTEYVTVGHLDAWRGFDLVIEAMAELVKTDSQVHLSIVGSGPDKDRLKAMVKKYSLERHVSLTGKVPMAQYRELMNRADVVVNAALKEGAVTVSFDCMAMGKPLICIDTTGFTRYFDDEYAVLIPRTSREEVITGLKDGMLRLTDAEERNSLGAKAREASVKFSWDIHGKEIRDIILKSYNA